MLPAPSYLGASAPPWHRVGDTVLISILPPRARSSRHFETKFALHQDNWNDYGFHTVYHLFKSVPNDEPELIGMTKILRRGQTRSDPLLLDTAFNQLGEEWVSVGVSLDYYQRLNELQTDIRDQLLTALRDAVYQPDLAAAFREESGWNVSLFRGSSKNGQPRDQQDRFLSEAGAILTGNYTAAPALSEPIRFSPTGWGANLDLQFDAPDAGGSAFRRSSLKATTDEMPHRCGVIIGPNGSGKSTLLSRFARVAFASPTERAEKDLAGVGTLEPAGIGFSKILTVSYSAFDSFTLPGVYVRDLQQIAKDVERGDGRFVYCGLRDIVQEVREDLQGLAKAENETTEGEMRLQLQERRDSTHLKPLGELAQEFARHLDLARQKNRQALLEQCVAILLRDRSFAGLDDRTPSGLIGDDPQASFLGWSTGHKIALHVVAAVIAHAEPRSIVLFDEPETHLHPPLTAAMMHALRFALDRTDAFAIVATHSPVVLQETLARHVRVVRRAGTVVTIDQPELETFGENIGTLVYAIFGLTADTTDFHDVLDALVKEKDTLEDLEALFQPGLSTQARAYVMAQLAAKADGAE